MTFIFKTEQFIKRTSFDEVKVIKESSFSYLKYFTSQQFQACFSNLINYCYHRIRIRGDSFENVKHYCINYILVFFLNIFMSLFNWHAVYNIRNNL